MFLFSSFSSPPSSCFACFITFFFLFYFVGHLIPFSLSAICPACIVCIFFRTFFYSFSPDPFVFFFSTLPFLPCSPQPPPLLLLRLFTAQLFASSFISRTSFECTSYRIYFNEVSLAAVVFSSPSLSPLSSSSSHAFSACNYSHLVVLCLCLPSFSRFSFSHSSCPHLRETAFHSDQQLTFSFCINYREYLLSLSLRLSDHFHCPSSARCVRFAVWHFHLLLKRSFAICSLPLCVFY